MDLFRKKDIGALRSMAQNSGLTKNLGAFIGRWIPALGITILTADVAMISYKTLSRYNTIAHPKDRIW